MRVLVALVGPRLVLREFVTTDLDSILKLACEEDILANWGWDAPTAEEAMRFLTEATQRQLQAVRSQYDLAIILAVTGELIGDCEIGFAPGETDAELGFCIAPDHRRRGYATDAVRRLIQFGFHELGMTRLYGFCDATNEASARTMARAGLVLERTGLSKNETTGKIQNSHLFAIHRDRWQP